jgi:hypothetical protein
MVPMDSSGDLAVKLINNFFELARLLWWAMLHKLVSGILLDFRAWLLEILLPPCTNWYGENIKP